MSERNGPKCALWRALRDERGFTGGVTTVRTPVLSIFHMEVDRLSCSYYTRIVVMDSRKDALAELARASSTGIVTAETAAAAWHSSDRRAASRRLAALSRQGWLRRVRKGTYEISPLEARSAGGAPYEDPWVLAMKVFGPCYIGGWSAAEHWGLTEQLFRETFVVTGANVRAVHSTVAGLEFRLARVPPERAVGDAVVWRRTARVPCSSPERTLVDAGNIPAWVGGARHLGDIIARYAETRTPDLDVFARCLSSHRRGAAAKRLGFLADRLGKGEQDASTANTLASIRDIALRHLSAGIVRLDPAVRTRGRMNTAWGLWINAEVARRET